MSTIAQSPARKQKALVPLAVPVPAPAPVETVRFRYPDELGPSVPVQMIRFRCPDDLAQRLKMEAVQRRTSIQRLCIEAVTAHLGGNQSTGG